MLMQQTDFDSTDSLLWYLQTGAKIAPVRSDAEVATTRDDDTSGHPSVARSDTPKEREVAIQRIEDYVAFYLAEVPQVERIFAEKDKDVFRVWAVIDRMDPAVLERIYGQEQQIIEKFGDQEFDFNVLFRSGRDVGQLISELKSQVFARP